MVQQQMTMNEEFAKFQAYKKWKNRVIKNQGYNEVSFIFNNLPGTERLALSEKFDTFKDSDLLVTRYIHYNEENMPIAYIDAYRLNEKTNNTVVNLKMAIIPEYRKKGLTKKLIKNIIKQCKELHCRKLFFKSPPDNTVLINVAKRNNFRLEYSTKTELVFSRYI